MDSVGLELCCKSRHTGGTRGSCTSCNHCRILSYNSQQIRSYRGTGTDRRSGASRTTTTNWASSSREGPHQRGYSIQNPWPKTRVELEIPETDGACWRVGRNSGNRWASHSGSSGRKLRSSFEGWKTRGFLLFMNKSIKNIYIVWFQSVVQITLSLCREALRSSLLWWRLQPAAQQRLG